MGCGASKSTDPLESKTPLATRGKSSSIVPVTVAPKSPEDDNPFLDPSPGVDEHRAKAKPAPAPITEPGVDLPSTPAPTADAPTITDVTPLTNRRSSKHRRTASSAADGSEGEDEDVTTDIPSKPKTPRSGSRASARQLKEVGEETKTADEDTEVASPRETASSPSARPAGAGHARLQSFTELLAQQPPSMVLSDPLRLTTLLPATFLHYAKKQYDTSPRPAAAAADDADEEKLDKKALQQLAYDCVLSFMGALKKDPALNKLKEPARKKEEEFLRRKLLPGDSVDECIETAVSYLKAELIYKNGCITKTCFFFHFPRAYRGLFVFEKMTLDRENLVTKWNKACREAAVKAAKDAAKEAEADRAAGESEKGDKKKDKKDKKGKKKKDRKTAPQSGDLFANMAGHGSKLLQAEKKMKSAAKAGSSRNLLKDLPNPKDDDED